MGLSVDEEPLEDTTATSGSITRRHVKAIQWCGILHLINALVILAIGSTIVGEFPQQVLINRHGTAIWTSAIFMVTGMLGIVIFNKPKNRQVIVSHNIFAFFSIVLAVLIVATSGLGIKYYHHCDRVSIDTDYGDGNLNYLMSFPKVGCRYETARKHGASIYGALLAFGVIEFFLAIASTIFSMSMYNCLKYGCPACDPNCCSCCCDDQKFEAMGKNDFTVLTIQSQYVPQGGQGQMPLVNQQQVLNPNPALNEEILTSSTGRQYVLRPLPPSNVSNGATPESLSATVTCSPTQSLVLAEEIPQA